MPIKKELRHFYRTPAWLVIRAAVRDRADDRCEKCGLTNGTYISKAGRRVLVQCGCAHLNNVPGDDRLDNLAWLCRRCHLHRDAPFHRLTRATRKDAARPLLKELYDRAQV